MSAGREAYRTFGRKLTSNITVGFPLDRLPRSFQRLQWKLTLSYALVTIAAIALVGVIGLPMFNALPSRDEMYKSLLTQALGNSAVDVTPYLRGTLSDREQLSDWLGSVLRRGDPPCTGRPQSLPVCRRAIDGGCR